MKAFEDPRFSDAALSDLAGDDRTRPMLHQYLIDVVAERSSCEPHEEPFYDETLLRIVRKVEEGGA